MSDLTLALDTLSDMALAVGVVELQDSPGEVLAAHRTAVYDAVLEYLAQSAPAASFANRVKKSIVERFPEMFYLTYFDGGAEQVDPADDRWLTQQINAHVGFVAGTFAELKIFRDRELPPRELVAEANRRADMYAASLEAVGVEGQLRGLKNQMLTWHLGDTEKHCKNCAALDGTRHTAKWYLSRNFIPGKPGAGMECGGWQCDCYLTDKRGDVIEIGD
jgi:hypothetical protein